MSAKSVLQLSPALWQPRQPLRLLQGRGRKMTSSPSHLRCHTGLQTWSDLFKLQGALPVGPGRTQSPPGVQEDTNESLLGSMFQDRSPNQAPIVGGERLSYPRRPSKSGPQQWPPSLCHSEGLQPFWRQGNTIAQSSQQHLKHLCGANQVPEVEESRVPFLEESLSASCQRWPCAPMAGTR